MRNCKYVSGLWTQKFFQVGTEKFNLRRGGKAYLNSIIHEKKTLCVVTGNTGKTKVHVYKYIPFSCTFQYFK